MVKNVNGGAPKNTQIPKNNSLPNVDIKKSAMAAAESVGKAATKGTNLIPSGNI